MSFSSDNTYMSLIKSTDDCESGEIISLLKHHTIGNKYKVCKYKSRHEVITILSQYLKNDDVYNSQSTQYTLVSAGEDYLDFLLATANKAETAILRISNIEKSAYYIEKIIHSHLSRNVRLITIKPDGLMIKINGETCVLNCKTYSNTITEFQYALGMFIHSASIIQSSKLYRFKKESLFDTFLRCILSIRKAKIPQLNKFLENKLEIGVNIGINDKVFDLSVDDIFTIKKYSLYFSKEDILRLQKWFNENLPSLEHYYKEHNNQFIKRNISHNNLLVIDSSSYVMFDYSKINKGCYLADLADYIALARASAYDIVNLDINKNEDLEYDFDVFGKNEDKNDNSKDNKDVLKKHMSKEIKKPIQTIVVDKAELNKLVVLSILKNAAINIMLNNEKVDQKTKEEESFEQIQTLSQLRDMIDIKYNQQMPEALLSLDSFSLKEYMHIIIKQCNLCLEDCENF